MNWTPTVPPLTRVVSTRVLISTHAWNGTRGVTLAERVAELERAGCAVQVIYAPGDGFGSGVRTILTDAEVPMNSGTHKGIHTHQKLLIIDGAVDGEMSTARVLTGSQNWSTRALARDDIMVEIDDDAVAADYISAFDRMMRNRLIRPIIIGRSSAWIRSLGMSPARSKSSTLGGCARGRGHRSGD